MRITKLNAAEMVIRQTTYPLPLGLLLLGVGIFGLSLQITRTSQDLQFMFFAYIFIGLNALLFTQLTTLAVNRQTRIITKKVHDLRKKTEESYSAAEAYKVSVQDEVARGVAMRRFGRRSRLYRYRLCIWTKNTTGMPFIDSDWDILFARSKTRCIAKHVSEYLHIPYEDMTEPTILEGIMSMFFSKKKQNEQ